MTSMIDITRCAHYSTNTIPGDLVCNLKIHFSPPSADDINPVSPIVQKHLCLLQPGPRWRLTTSRQSIDIKLQWLAGDPVGVACGVPGIGICDGYF